MGESGRSKTNLTVPEMFHEDVEPGGSNIDLIDDETYIVPLVNEDITDDEEQVTSHIVERPKRIHVPNKRTFNEDFVVNQAMSCRTTDPATVEEALSS